MTTTTMKVWVNGRFVDRDQAMVSVFDAGLQHGIGLFETMLAQSGRVYRLREHLERLAASARELRLTDELRVGPLAEAVERTVAESGLTEGRARVRLTLTGGDLNLLQTQRQHPSTPTLIIVAQPATPYPDILFEQGVRVAIADGRLNPFDPVAGHKTLNYWSRLRALQEVAQVGGGECLWLSVTNHLMGGSVSNIFLVKDGLLHTPIARGEEPKGGIPSPVLPGITRRAIIELAEQERIGVNRQMLDVDALLAADEVFLTNSSWGVLPVVRAVAFQEEVIGSGQPGPITRRLRGLWLEDVRLRTTLDPGVEVDVIGHVPRPSGDAPTGDAGPAPGPAPHPRGPGRNGDSKAPTDPARPPHSNGSTDQANDWNEDAEPGDPDVAG